MSSDKFAQWKLDGVIYKPANEYDLQAKTYPTICSHHKLHNDNENKYPVFPECICNKWQNMM